jgi:diacylglycerol kinase family enzyme
VTLIANAEFRGKWDVAPRAHPGDGLLDVIEMSATMSSRARLQAWKRVRLGTHLPHPDLRSRQIAVAAWTFSNPQRIWVDGKFWHKATEVQVQVLPEDFHLLV